jgi:hypothetical protein
MSSQIVKAALEAGQDITSEDLVPRALEYLRHALRSMNLVTGLHDAEDSRAYLVAAFSQLIASVAIYSSTFDRLAPLFELDPELGTRIGKIASLINVGHVSKAEAEAINMPSSTKIGEA